MQPLLPEEIELAEAELAEILETGGGTGSASAGAVPDDPGGGLGGLSRGSAGSPEEEGLPGSEPFGPADASGAGTFAAAELDDLPELPPPDEDPAGGFGSAFGEAGDDPDLGGLPPLPAPDEDLPGPGPRSGFGGFVPEPWTTASGGPLPAEGGDDSPEPGGAAISTPYLCYVNLFLAKHYCHLYQKTGEAAYLRRCRYYYARFVRCRG
jgi:hypothetical protein